MRLRSFCYLALSKFRTSSHGRNTGFLGPGRCGLRRHPAPADPPTGTVAGQAPLAHRPFAHGQTRGLVAARLRLRRRALLQLRWRAGRGSGTAAPGPAAAGRHAGGPLPAHAGAHRQRSRRPARPAVHRRLPRAVPVQPAAAPACAGGRLHGSLRRRHPDRPGRQQLLRPDRLLWRQCVRGRRVPPMHCRRQRPRPGPGPGAGQPAPQRGRQRGTPAAHLGLGPGVLPHVGHRSRDAGRAPGPLPHRPAQPGALLRRLPRLVGRRAARPRRETYTLRDMHDNSLQVLRKRRDIACVLINPLQALHPNKAAPGDSSLVDSSRSAGYDRAAYTEWLKQLREVCTERGIVLIFDEVFLGFRLAPGGAQEYFGVKADMVTYGKTLGGGLPVGVVCGKRELMKRYREDRPADLCFARGTFNSHPYVMGAMHAFLDYLETPEAQLMYVDLDATQNRRAAQLNQRLQAIGAPVQVANMSSVWTVSYTRPSRYNWMLQFYLREQGLALSWVGTGRLIFSLNYTEADFEEVCRRFVTACQAMEAGGWWWQDAAQTNKSIKRSIFREMLAHRRG